jgi:beta-lactamase class A
MSVGDLCAATIITSDNTAANLLEPLVGGPAGLQDFVRGLGDQVMRFDRIEPELNSNIPGDPRDTTTPEAMSHLLRSAFENKALSESSLNKLFGWMKAATTGAARIRAGIPVGWEVGDKTGTSYNGATNDVAIIHPPKGDPIYLCVFTDGNRTNTDSHNAAIAKVASLVVERLF